MGQLSAGIRIALLFWRGSSDSVDDDEVEGAGVLLVGGEWVAFWGIASFGSGWSVSAVSKEAVETDVSVVGGGWSAGFESLPSAGLSSPLSRLLFFLLKAL